jgi:tRNA (cmo5U34)-methyltransferase
MNNFNLLSFKDEIMSSVKKRFEAVAEEYDETVQLKIPYYDDLVKALINSIPFNKEDKFKVLDLGCGTGNISKFIKETFPNSYLTCLDLSEKMIEMAKIKLKDYDNIEFLNNDFQNIDYKNEFDMIVSSLAIHHIEKDDGKKKLYSKIFESLKENGAFYNGDVVLSSTEFGINKNNEVYKELISKKLSKEKVNELIKNANNVDYPVQLVDQLKWFEEIGFRNVDITWKLYGVAVYGGFK